MQLPAGSSVPTTSQQNVFQPNSLQSQLDQRQENNLELAPDSERSGVTYEDDFNSARQDHLDAVAASPQSSANGALNNLDVNLEEINKLNSQGGLLNDPPQELLMSEIQQNAEKNSADEGEELAEMEKMLKSGAFPKDLSGTFKKIRQEVGGDYDKLGEHDDDGLNQEYPMQGIQGEDQTQSPDQDALGDPDQNYDGESGIDIDGLTESEMQALKKQTQEELDSGLGMNETSALESADQEEDDEDVIDVDNPEDLARKGLKKIQIEGEDEAEYLMDEEGNIYDMQGNFIGTTGEEGNEDGEEGDSQIEIS